MRKTILTILASAVLSVSALQIAAAAEHHKVHKVYRAPAPVGEPYRNSNAYYGWPAPSEEFRLVALRRRRDLGTCRALNGLVESGSRSRPAAGLRFSAALKNCGRPVRRLANGAGCDLLKEAEHRQQPFYGIINHRLGVAHIFTGCC